MKAKPHFDESDAAKLSRGLATIQEPDLLVLKALASIEHMIVCLLATRLGGDPETLPDIGFARATQMALMGRSEVEFRKVLESLRTLRNRIAHEIDSVPSGEVNSFIERVFIWAAAHKLECRYEISEPQNLTEPLDRLRWALLSIFNHVCHLRESAMPAG